MEYKFKVFAKEKSRNPDNGNSCLVLLSFFRITSDPGLLLLLPEALPEVTRLFCPQYRVRL